MNLEILNILSYDFMIRALIGGFLIGILSSIIGVFLVLRRLSLLGDSFAHASFGGIAIGFILKINPLYSALFFVSLISLGIDKLVNKMKIYGDAAIALFLSFGMALALILISISGNLNSQIFSYLFGSILTISYNDIYLMCLILIILIIFLYFNYKNLLFSTFNNEMAIVRNKNIIIVDKIFIILSGIIIVISIRAVGILLISALLVIPTLISLNYAKSFRQTIFYSVFSSIIGIYIGILFSYLYDIPTGGSIVMSLILLYGISIISKSFK